MSLVFVNLLLAIAGLYLSAALHELGHAWGASRFGGRLAELRIGGGSRLFGRVSRGVRWGVGTHPFGGLSVCTYPAAGKNNLLKLRRCFFMSLCGPLSTALLCIAMVVFSVPAEYLPAWCLVLGANLWMLWKSMKPVANGSINDGVLIRRAFRMLWEAQARKRSAPC